MKKFLSCACFLFAAASVCQGQGGFLFDQQSNTEEAPFWGTGSVIQQYAPVGQSFTPALDIVGFVRLKLYDANVGNGLGATLSVRLHSQSMTGPMIAATEPVTLQDGRGGVVQFEFSAPPTVQPGIMHFFEIEVSAGDSWRIDSYEYRYAGGTAFGKGLSNPASDLWFREGIIVPEPGTGAVLGLGLGLLVWVRRPRSS